MNAGRGIFSPSLDSILFSSHDAPEQGLGTREWAAFGAGDHLRIVATQYKDTLIHMALLQDHLVTYILSWLT
jgi:hypothetical protein